MPSIWGGVGGQLCLSSRNAYRMYSLCPSTSAESLTPNVARSVHGQLIIKSNISLMHVQGMYVYTYM